MNKKPTYSDLENRIRQLETELEKERLETYKIPIKNNEQKRIFRKHNSNSRR